MKKIILSIGLVILITGQLFGQTVTITGPQLAQPGDLVVLTPVDIQDARTTWILNYPEQFEQYAVEGDKLFLAMPAGRVKFTLLVIPDDTAKPIQQIPHRLGNDSVPPDDDGDDGDEPPPPPDDDDPEPVDEYTGPNKFAGQLSFESAPAYNAEVVRVYREAAWSLYGRNPDGSTADVQRQINIRSDPERNRTNENVFVWISQQISPIAESDPAWRTWYHTVMQRIDGDDELNVEIRLKSDWHEAFLEIAAGVEAKQGAQ